MPETTPEKKVKLTKPESGAVATRDHVISQLIGKEQTTVNIIKGKTKFSDIHEKFHETVIVEKLF